MPATTRTSTNSLPARISSAVSSLTNPGPTTTTKRRGTKANTSKPRDKKVAGGRVGKSGGTTTTTTTTKTTKTTGGRAGAGGPKKTIHKKKAPGRRIVDKVKGTAEKAVGEVEGKPGKKAAGTRKKESTTTKRIAAPGTATV